MHELRTAPLDGISDGHGASPEFFGRRGLTVITAASVTATRNLYSAATIRLSAATGHRHAPRRNGAKRGFGAVHTRAIRP